jgi:hypothetical protein
MSEYWSIFYGNTEPLGYKISYLLLSRNIKHDFVLYDKDYVFVLETSSKIREFTGFEAIYDYIESYKYIYDFPEISKWKY